MNRDEILKLVSLNEDSVRQFKADVHNGLSLASEMAAFANAEGGVILFWEWLTTVPFQGFPGRM
jgi:ATP-dependent DNA helicase RecG